MGGKTQAKYVIYLFSIKIFGIYIYQSTSINLILQVKLNCYLGRHVFLEHTLSLVVVVYSCQCQLTI